MKRRGSAVALGVLLVHCVSSGQEEVEEEEEEEEEEGIQGKEEEEEEEEEGLFKAGGGGRPSSYSSCPELVREMLSEKEAQVWPGATAPRGNRVHPQGRDLTRPYTLPSPDRRVSKWRNIP